MLWTLLVVLIAGAAGFAAHSLWKNGEALNRLGLGLIVFLALTGAGRAVVRPRVVEAERMKIPLYRAIKTYEPELYDELKTDIGDRDGTNQLALLGRTKIHMAKLLTKYAPRASDESLYQLLLVSTDILGALSKGSPSEGFNLAVPGSGTMNLANLKLPPNAVERELEALANMIESGATSKPQPFDAAQADAILARTSERVVRPFGDSVYTLENRSADTNQRARGMEILTTYYRNVLALPPAERSLAIRRIFMQSARSQGMGL